MLRKRIVSLRQLRELAPIYGFETIVYLDESRFEAASCRQAIGERIGHKVYADGSGHKGPQHQADRSQTRQAAHRPVLFERLPMPIG